MSEIEIKVPNIGDFKDVEVIEVLVSEGQTLKKNDPLITIESDKSSVEIPSNFDGKIKTLTNDGEYGEIGVDNGKYGLIHEEHGGLYGLINNNDKCQPEQNNKNCRKDSDYISLNKCNTDHLSKKRKKISDANSALAKDIASAETIYKQQLAGMMDDWYKIDDAFCIFNEKKNRYDKCISDHKGGNVLSYSEFKNTDSEYKNNLESQKQKGINDAVRDFTNKYKTGPAKGQSCLPGNPSEYTEPNSCTHLGDNLECKHTKFNKTQAELTGAISSKKDTIKQSIIDKGFNDNIDKYANKYSDSGDQCNPSTNVPKHWRPVSSPCEDSEKSCGIKCADDNCLTGKSCIPKDKTITESQMTFEDSTDITDLTDPTTFNEYKKGYNDAKNTWMGKYDNGTTCNPIEYVDPNNWKFQDSDDVCGGNLKCINVKEYLDKINKSSNNLNEDACTKLNRDSCKLMNKKYNDCVNKKVIITCPAGQEPDTSQCNRTNGTTICKACPNCGLNQYRVDTGPTLDSDGKYKYCGTCKNKSTIYGWGYSYLGTLGYSSSSVENNTTKPNPIKYFINNGITIKKVCTDYHHTLFLTNKGKVYAIGRNSDGELANGTTNSEYENPVLCSKLNDYEVLDIGTCYKSSYFLVNGKVFTCGATEHLAKYTEIEYLPNDPYNGTYNSNSKAYYNPVELKKLRGKKIIKMFCKSNHCMFLSSDNKLYAIGYNNFGQLGLGAGVGRTLNNSYGVVRTVEKVSFFNNINIKDVALGNKHTLVLTTDGDVYSFGKNDFGQLYRAADENFNDTPKKVASNISYINASYFRSMLLTTTKRVIYSVGYNSYGGLGIGNKEHKRSSQKIDFFDKNKINITKMASGKYHSLFLSEDGDVYAVGGNDHGQVGYGAKDSLGIDNIKKVTVSGKIKDIFAGWDRSYCITK